jgi:hypothetical protein
MDCEAAKMDDLPASSLITQDEVPWRVGFGPWLHNSQSTSIANSRDWFRRRKIQNLIE